MDTAGEGTAKGELRVSRKRGALMREGPAVTAPDTTVLPDAGFIFFYLGSGLHGERDLNRSVYSCLAYYGGVLVVRHQVLPRVQMLAILAAPHGVTSSFEAESG